MLGERGLAALDDFAEVGVAVLKCGFAAFFTGSAMSAMAADSAGSRPLMDSEWCMVQSLAQLGR